MAMTGMLPALYKHTGAFDAALGAGEAPAALTLSAALPGAGYGAGAAPPAAAIAFSPDAHYVLPTGAVVSIFINNTDGGEHPMHIHGHSFFVVASSARPDAEAAFAGNQLYRDVVSVAAGGWVKLLLVADNPGVWALHCHIDFHLAAGLMVELFEDLPALAGLAVPPQRVDRYAPFTGKEMTLGLRPEHLTEIKDQEKPNVVRFDATVDVLEPMGMETMVHFFIDGQPVCARIDPNTPAAPREILPLAADMNNMHLIENDSGKVV